MSLTALEPKSALMKKQGQPLIIAGPCSAETEEQVMETARRIKAIGRVDIFRAGIWKPRTRPGCFEGVGVEGLHWMKRVQREVGLPVAIEVAKANHVYEALKFGIDVLWIGARTTVSPFAVQEIADALQGVDIPVWVKNPVNPDLGLWLGAIERLEQAGLSQIGAIHRGFSSSDKHLYRNIPRWEMAIELKRKRPDLPIICDPSHISGKREYLGAIAQKAYDLDLDGVMLESHITPDTAWSDPAQQVTPEVLADLIDSLTFHINTSNDPNQNLLETLRGEIDDIDRELLELISRRNQVATRIGSYKRDHNMPILQVNRWKTMLDQRIDQASHLGLNPEFIKDIYQKIHLHSIEVQG